LLYVTGRRGYKSGGFNLNTPEHSVFSSFQPEFVTDVEIGVKADWTVLGAKARTDIDAFHTDYTDIQRAISVLINGLSSPVTENAAVATIEGVEFEGTILPTSRTEISVSYSYLVSKYDKYVSPTLGDLSGLQFPFTPKNKLSLTGRYHLPIGSDLGDLSLAATYLMQSSVNAGPDYDPTDVIQGYGLLNLRLDWKQAMGSDFDASLFVTNATDTVYRTRLSALYNIFGIAGASYGEPRIFGAQLRYRFGP
jgi:iron complex outermembrane receptor protein